MRRLAVFLSVALFTLPALASVPEPYRGAWTLDRDASMRAIDAAEGSLTPQQKERLIRGLTVDLKDLVLELTDSTMIYTIPGQSMSLSLTLESAGDDQATFSSKEAGTVSLHLDSDGLLNLQMSQDDDFDLFYFRRRDPSATAAEAPPANPSVAYLDSLKACIPGAHHLAYPGLGTYTNTITGRVGDRCQVRIKHPQFTLSCNYSDAMIALLTSDAKYQEARDGILSGSTDSEESKLASEECTPD